MTMDSSEDGDDADSNINDLLNALEGIEQCFVTDFEVQKAQLKPASLSPSNAKKRPIEPELPTIPTPKRVSWVDPRLQKNRSSSIVPKPVVLPVPNFVKSDDPPKTNTTNSERIGSKKSILKPIVISNQLSNYLKLKSSLLTKSKKRPANGCRTSTRSQKSSALLKLAKNPEKDALTTRRITVQEPLIKKLSQESRKIEAPLEKLDHKISSASIGENHSIESSKMPLPGGKSKCEEKANSLQLPPSIENLNFKTIDDFLLHGMNSGLPFKEITWVPYDPQLIKSVAPRNPVELPQCPIKSRVSTVTRDEDETVKVSKDPEKSLCMSQPSNHIPEIEKAVSKVNGEKKASKKDTAQIEKCASPEKKKKSKRVTFKIDFELPSEILMKIFEYLTFSDRKKAKLVCRFWNDVCNLKLFLMRQRFVCSGIYDTSSILGTLSNSGCAYFNLEFHRVDFCDIFSAYWKQLGPKIHALYFVDCVLAEETLGDVIVNCTEMEHLSLSFERLRVPSVKLFSLSLFEKLFKRRIERPKLASLDIQINSDGWFSNAVLSNLFSIYPNVTKFSFTCHTLNPVAAGVEAVLPCEIDFTDLWSSKALTFSPVLKYVLSPPDSMEKLRLDVHTRGARTGFGWQLVISNSKFTRLREVVIEIDLKRLSGNAVIEFCVAQSQLKSVTCKITGPAKLFISLFLLKLLDNCPRLRNLNVSYNAAFLMSYELFKRLAACELKSLSIECKNVLLAPQIDDEFEWPINEHLKSLSLSQGVGDNLSYLLLHIYSNLRFLEIHDLTDELLQLIWKYQTKLITLKLAGVEECTIDGFCGAPENTSSSSIRNLRNLEYLVLETVNNEWKVYGNVFSEFQFPKLRYFCVDIEGSTTLQNDLLEAMQNFTELEGVSITTSGIKRSAWLELNKNWKKLRYLRIVDKESDRFKRKSYLAYFKTSPNLRAFFHEFKNSTESYYYDILQKKIERKINSAKYRISSEKVGNCFVDWLWF